MLVTARKQDLDDTVAIHPTSAEGLSKIPGDHKRLIGFLKRISHAALEHLVYKD